MSERPPHPHSMTGRECSASGVATYCRCGLVFFEAYGFERETDQSRERLRVRADARYDEHRAAVGE